MAAIDYERKYKEYQNQTGDIRRGIGMSVFWYNTAVWPISLETSSCRMVLNQDGSLQVQLGETEPGQDADTAYTQMAADVVGVRLDQVHVVSCQDTDVTPFGTGAYASRQTYTAGFSIRQTGLLLKERILNYAHELTRMPSYNLDIVEGNIGPRDGWPCVAERRRTGYRGSVQRNPQPAHHRGEYRPDQVQRLLLRMAASRRWR